MHAVVVRVTLNDIEAATKALHEQVVPAAKEAPGFVAAYWLRKDNTGLSFGIYESEEAARAAAERVPQMVPDPVTLEDVEVRSVEASA